MSASAPARNRFASMEQDADGTWIVYNEVTGLVCAEGLSFARARATVYELGQHYGVIERRAGW